VALRNAIPIRSITLFVFGGVAQTGGEPTAAGVEFRIAIAGPLTSFALALGFGGLGFLAHDVTVVAAPATWLARMNAMVAAFNLIPGFPLDGGRVLRAVVWRWTGSFQQAARIAVSSGQLLAFGFMALGILMALRGNVLGGVWIALIGWFLQNAASADQVQARLHDMLRGVTVAQAMASDCPRVAGDATLEWLVHAEVLGAGRRCFLVTENGHLRGLLTLHEVKGVPREQWGKVRAEEIMTPRERLVVVEPREDLLAALSRMDDAGVAQLPVVAGEELVGMIGREHILRYIRVRAELGT
jgi:CBS domain-containing protein